MPSWELFASQPAGYREQVLPPGMPRLGVEAAGPFGWCAWADDVVSLDRFGASAPAQALFREFGFTPENVAARAQRLLTQRGGS
jgi:transketolase